MTEKQFKCTNISANGMTGLFWLGKDQISVYDVLKILNDLSEENEQLKKVAKCELVANHRGEMVGFADSLIHDFCDNKAIEMWEKFKEEKWEEYKYKTGFNQNKEVERMTDKRFTLTTTEFDGTLSFHDAIYDCETRMSTEYVLNAVETTLNQFAEENEQLKEENKELRQDDDIKFWKMQCLQSLNNNQMMLFELGRAIQQGYEVSDKFKQYLDEIKEHDKEIREKHKRLFE